MIKFQLMLGEAAREIDPEHFPWPFDTLVLFAFEDEKVVGRSAILNMPLIEGTWVADAYRGSTLMPRLVKEVEKLLFDLKKTHSMAWQNTEQPEVADYLTRMGYTKLPIAVWTKELQKET